MKRTLFKPIVGGLIAGIALFLMPFFLLRIALFFLVVGTLFRIFVRRKFSGMGFGPNFADKIRAMSDEEYAAFKEKFQGHCSRNRTTDEAKMMI